MSLIVQASGSGSSTEPAATPHEISFALADDGAGGTVNITEGLPAPADLFDVPAFFAPNFPGSPWMAFFNKPFLSAAIMAAEFWRTYSVTMYPLLGTQRPAPTLTVHALNGGKPHISFTSPDGGEDGGIWRIEIRLRNTSTR